MRNKILILIGLFAGIAGLFFFSRWTNGMVVSEAIVSGSVSGSMRTLALVSPFVAGVFILFMITILIRMSVD